MDTETELRNIRTRISQTQSRQARAQIELDNATAKLAAAKATLKEEFSVVTNAHAKVVLAGLEGDYAAALEEVESQLEAAGA